MEDKNDNPEIWEDWEDEWSEDYLKEATLFENGQHEDPENIASLGGDYYKMFMHPDKHQGS